MNFGTNKTDYYADYDVNTFFSIANLQQRITKLFANADLLNAAVFWFTNIERRKHNLKQFRFHDKLRQTAVLHSEQMKIHNFFDHNNAFDARYATLTNRIESVKDNTFKGFMSWGENIAYQGKEPFEYSYREFAKTVVEGWMNSPGHRANILNPDFEYLGCGCAKYEQKENGYSMLCFKLTQNFGGKLMGSSFTFGFEKEEITQSTLNPRVLDNKIIKVKRSVEGLRAKIKINNMLYTESLSRAKPGLMIICLDQSGSMADNYASAGERKSKADFAALAVNKVIAEVLAACTKEEGIRDYCTIALVGYGANSEFWLKTPSELALVTETQTLKKKEPDGAGGTVEVDTIMRVFVNPVANGGTPMAEAFEEAKKGAEQFIESHPDSFPPIVINITDGEPNSEPAARSKAQELMQLKTTDGNLILMNAHISNASAGKIELPNNKNGIQGNKYAEFLYDISSELPDILVQTAQGAGFNAQNGSKGFIFNADAEALVKFLDFGTKTAR